MKKTTKKTTITKPLIKKGAKAPPFVKKGPATKAPAPKPVEKKGAGAAKKGC